MQYQAEPLKRAQLRTLALEIRTAVGLENRLWFPVVRFMELVMPLWYPKFHYEIVQKSELPPRVHADTDVVHHVIRIREDVYDRACADHGRDRMTVAHEAAHYILMAACGVKFARSFGGSQIPPYCDPEWHAKALSGELLCPHHLIKGMHPRRIAALCGVSGATALYSLEH